MGEWVHVCGSEGEAVSWQCNGGSQEAACMGAAVQVAWRGGGGLLCTAAMPGKPSGRQAGHSAGAVSTCTCLQALLQDG